MQFSCVKVVLPREIISSFVPKVRKEEVRINSKLKVCCLADIDTPSTPSF